MKIGIAVLGVLAVLVQQAAAQTVLGHGPPVDRGTRIRLTDQTQARREGVLVEWRGDSALARIDQSGEYVLVPPDLVRAIEVYDGKTSRAGKGAVIGGVTGLGLSLFLVLAASSDEFTQPEAGEAAAAIVVGTLSYAGIGALIGSFVKVPRWRTMTDAPRLQAIADPRGRVGLAVRLGF